MAVYHVFRSCIQISKRNLARMRQMILISFLFESVADRVKASFLRRLCSHYRTSKLIFFAFVVASFDKVIYDNYFSLMDFEQAEN